MLSALLLPIALASSRPAVPSSQPAGHELRVSIPGQEVPISCWLSEPPGYTRKDRAALLIVLHGSDDWDGGAFGLQFWSGLRHDLPLVIAAPQAAGRGWGS